MRFLKLVFASLSITVSITSAYPQSRAESALNNFISKQAKRDNVKEYKDAREVIYGDINGDGTDDLIVLYTLDGFKANVSYKKYLAVFLRRGGKFQFVRSRVVNRATECSIKLKSIDRETINLETLEYMEYGENHYRIQGKIRFILTGKKLKEI